MIVANRRIEELDGLRGIAVLMVLAWHFAGETIRPGPGSMSSLILSVLMFGRTGVDLFFVLSGFLIFGILIDHKGSTSFFQTFYIRRTARILPSYLLLITAFWTISSLTSPGYYFGKEIPLFTYLTFTQNWWMSLHNDWGPAASNVTWSVAIEEQFYMLFPIVVLLTPPKRLKVLLLLVGLTSAGSRAAFHLIYPTSAFAPYVNTLLRMDGLCLGGLLSIIHRSPVAFGLLRSCRTAVAVAFATFAAFAPMLVWRMREDTVGTMYYWGHSYLAILYGMALATVLTFEGSSKLSWLRSSLLNFFGMISYSLYLFHPLILGLFFWSQGRIESLSSTIDALLLLGAFASTVLYCWISFQIFEAKIVAWGHTFRYSG